MIERPKLLWHSNAPWTPTGYGQQTALFTPKLAEHYNVHISAFYGLEGNALEHSDIVVYPGIGGTYGNEAIQNHAQRHFGENLRDGLVLALMDVWVLDPKVWQEMNVTCWCPVDHDPVPPMVRRFFERTDAVPIAMSKFGQDRLSDFDALYCPHAVDTSVYTPTPKDKARERSKLPQDAFVVGMVAANKGQPSRKRFPEALRAFKAFRERHDDAILYLHTEMLGNQEGINLPQLITTLELEDSVHLTDQYRYVFSPVGSQTMASIYSSLDVLLNPSAGEGFGIPILEAQACGVPAIVTDFTSMPEVCGAGWKVEHRPVYTSQMSWQADPDVEDIVESLESCYRMPAGARQQLSEKARQHAETYDVDRVMTERMLPALERVQERFSEREPMKLKAVAA